MEAVVAVEAAGGVGLEVEGCHRGPPWVVAQRGRSSHNLCETIAVQDTAGALSIPR